MIWWKASEGAGERGKKGGWEKEGWEGRLGRKRNEKEDKCNLRVPLGKKGK